jgi:hypothetical protein
VKSRLAGYYAKAAKEYKDDSIKPPWETASVEPVDLAALAARAVGVSPERAALELLAASDAMSGTCANGDCEHPAGDHLGDHNGGPCTVEGCDCESFEEGATAAAETVTFTLQFSPESIERAAAILLEGAGLCDSCDDAAVERASLESVLLERLATIADTLPGPGLAAERPERAEPSVAEALPVEGGLSRRRPLLVRARRWRGRLCSPPAHADGTFA